MVGPCLTRDLPLKTPGLGEHHSRLLLSRNKTLPPVVRLSVLGDVLVDIHLFR